ncbi:MAG: D-alanyl-D-alanine endopeptidase [Pseudomonadota bacterium]|nr:D-alanyl-D-alanine endopeptidase [Pseudomonadota bacterium]
MIRKLTCMAFLICLGAAGAAVAAPATATEGNAKTRVRVAKHVHSPSVARTRQLVIVHRNRHGRRVATLVRFEPAHPSFGQLQGLHNAADLLELKSGVALVMDQETDEILFSKNPQTVLPIASLTKLMTAVVVTEANLPLNEPITITDDDVDMEKNSRSRLKVGTTLRREEMLHLALMSSENRAAHALGRTFPGGLGVFVTAMNAKARGLGMSDTHYVEPTGLSSLNQSSARDLVTLVKAAHEHRIIRELSTSPEYEVEVGNRSVQFRNTNGLLKSPEWDISLQKTGYITEAGRCLVMQAKLAGRQLIMVFLDSAGKYSRIGDAERVRQWINASTQVVPVLSVGKPKV